MPEPGSASFNQSVPDASDATPEEPPSIPVWHAAGAIVLSIAVLGVIGYFTFEPEVFWKYAKRMNPWYLALAVAAVGTRVLFGGWRLHYISDGRVTFSGGLRGQLAWDFFSNITPSAIGGAPVATFYVARDARLRMGETTALMLFSMLLDQFWFAFTIPVLLIGSFYLEIFPPAAGLVGQWVLAGFFLLMLAWTMLFAYATLVRIDFLDKLARWITSIRGLRRFRERVKREMTQMRRRATLLRGQPKRFFVYGFLLTAGAWISRYLSLVFVVWSVFTNMDHLLIFLRSAGLMLLALALPTPGGSGGIEGLYALFIGPLIPEAVLAPTLVMWRILAYYLFIAIGVYLTMYQVHKEIRRQRSSPPNGQPADESTSAAENAERAEEKEYEQS